MTDATPNPSPCVVCGYDLTGVAAPICPECASPRVDRPGSRFVEQPWPCVRCGYSLLGADREGSCPECGSPVARSLDPTLLRFQPEKYLRGLERGALFITLGIVTPVLAPCLLGGVLSLMGIGGTELVFWVLALTSYCMLVRGVWLITALPPYGARSKRRWSSRNILRVSIVGVGVGAASILAGWGLLSTLQMQSGANAWALRVSMISTIASSWVIMTMALTSILSGAFYTRVLMRSVVVRGLRRAAYATCTILTMLSAIVLGLLPFAVTANRHVAPAPQAMFDPGLIGSLLIFVTGIVLFVSLIGMAESFLAAVKRERRISHVARRRARVFPGASPEGSPS